MNYEGKMINPRSLILIDAYLFNNLRFLTQIFSQFSIYQMSVG